MRARGVVSFIAAAAVLLAGMELFHPAARGSQNQPVSVEGVNMPVDVSEIFARACQDCHSNQTLWPWYAYVPPLSMLIAKDVDDGRAFMNVSKWSLYSKGRKLGYLASIASAATTGEMPPRRYTLIHGDARLSDADRKKIADWAALEMARLSHR